MLISIDGLFLSPSVDVVEEMDVTETEEMEINHPNFGNCEHCINYYTSIGHEKETLPTHLKGVCAQHKRDKSRPKTPTNFFDPKLWAFPTEYDESSMFMCDKLFKYNVDDNDEGYFPKRATFTSRLCESAEDLQGLYCIFYKIQIFFPRLNLNVAIKKSGEHSSYISPNLNGNPSNRRVAFDYLLVQLKKKGIFVSNWAA